MENDSPPPLFTISVLFLLVALSFPVFLLKAYTAVWCWGLLAVPAGAPELPIGVVFGALFVYGLARLGTDSTDSEGDTIELLGKGFANLLVQSSACLIYLGAASLWAMWLY